MADVFSSEYYDELLTELEELRQHTAIDPEPLCSGLGGINRKLAEIQAARERVSSIVSAALHNKSVAQQRDIDAQNEYQRLTSRILVEDNAIKGMRSSDLRKAAVDVRLEDNVLKTQMAATTLLQAETFLKRAVSVNKDIEAKFDTLCRQIDLVREELRSDPALRDAMRQSVN